MHGFLTVLDLPEHSDANGFEANQSPLRFAPQPARLEIVKPHFRREIVRELKSSKGQTLVN